MELNWTTFVLEIINFLVLVWILKRFLYRPVLEVIEARRRRIEATLAEATQRQAQAEDLRAQYENRIAEWQQEKQTAREAFQREMQQQRGQSLQALEDSLAAAREKDRVLEERRWRELTEGAEQKGLQLGARFATRLLEKLSGPEIEERILVLLGEGLMNLPDDQRSMLHRAAESAHDGILVETARTLSPEQREIMERAVQESLGEGVRCRFHEDPALIAGLRLSVGDWSLGLNLHDELKGFAEVARAVD